MRNTSNTKDLSVMSAKLVVRNQILSSFSTVKRGSASHSFDYHPYMLEKKTVKKAAKPQIIHSLHNAVRSAT